MSDDYSFFVNQLSKQSSDKQLLRLVKAQKS